MAAIFHQSVNGVAQPVQCGANGCVLVIPLGTVVSAGVTADDLAAAPASLTGYGIVVWPFPSCVVTTSAAIVAIAK